MTDVLDALRAQVDRSDEAIVEAIGRRWTAIAAIAEHKKARAIQGVDPERERAVRERWRALAERENVPLALIDAVFDAVIAHCRAEVERASRGPGLASERDQALRDGDERDPHDQR